MIESRCGLLCSECKYREIMKCAGCLAIKKPYWGPKCPIKNCCETKGKENCGQCDRFACKQLHEFAFDPATQDEGDRIERCEEWAAESGSMPVVSKSPAPVDAASAGSKPEADAPASN